MTRTYSELCKFDTFLSRFNYLKLGGNVGELTFGWRRYMNQVFYKSDEWKDIRRFVIMRDNACDLGIDGREIVAPNRIYIHHINPITVEDIQNRTIYLLDPEYLISTTKLTHDAIHYGDESLLYTEPTTRFLNDTCPWKL